MARMLATVAEIAEKAAIPGAEAIEAVRVRGWWLVARIGEFDVGDRCVYLEIDSMLDVTDPRFAFLAPRGVRTDVEGRSGHRLRTVRLRGQLSQGLALPASSFPELDGLEVGSDVTELLGVWKWEPPLPASLAGEVFGPLPSFVRKTDEERVQNCFDSLDATLAWEATEKLDGSSMTVALTRDPAQPRSFVVCGRNFELQPSDANTFWRLATELELDARLATAWPDAAYVVVQGECVGEGIQANPLRLRGQRFAPFTLWVDHGFVPRSQWPRWLDELGVPVLEVTFPVSVADALASAERTSALNGACGAEGVVWAAPFGRGDRVSCKALSNRYLLKHGG